MVLATDGIFDTMSSLEVQKTIWDDLMSCNRDMDMHAILSSAVEAVLKESINKRTEDNITVLMVAFSAGRDNDDKANRENVEQHTEYKRKVNPANNENLNQQNKLKQSLQPLDMNQSVLVRPSQKLMKYRY